VVHLQKAKVLHNLITRGVINKGKEKLNETRQIKFRLATATIIRFNDFIGI
jgi:hypothetical protein